MENGVEAWWGDLGEPEKHPPGLYHNLRDYGYSRLFSADEVHNLYGHTWTKMLYQYYAKDYPDKRLFSLNRSGFAGSQRYCIFPWTGDVSRSWSGLRAQLPILLGMSMSGIPYVHSDAGGFAGGDGDNELYIRWLQFAAFTPIFRPHGTALYEKDSNAFSFPSEAALIDSPYRDIAKDIIHMRYGFLPYNYSLAYQHTRFGKPLMAPLYYYFSSDTTTYRVDDEFMWGDHILVAPVLQKGAVTRTYYLPAGSWYKAGTPGRFVTGHSWQTDSVILSQFPIFFREGAFVVFDARSAADTRSESDSLGITYIASEKASSFQLYNDDGKTKGAIEKNKYELVSFSSSGIRRHELTLSVVSNNGVYTGKKNMKLMLFTIAQEMGTPKSILINNKPCTRATSLSPKEKYTYVYSEDGLIYFWIRFSASPVSINLKW